VKHRPTVELSFCYFDAREPASTYYRDIEIRTEAEAPVLLI
jgi:hypothetical protein